MESPGENVRPYLLPLPPSDGGLEYEYLYGAEEGVDLSGLTHTWLLTNAIANRRINRKYNVHPIFHFNSLLAIGPLTKEEMDVTMRRVQVLRTYVHPDYTYIIYPRAWVRESIDRYFMVADGVYGPDDEVTVASGKSNNIIYNYIVFHGPFVSLVDILSGKYPGTRNARELLPDFVPRLLYQVCLLFILDVGDLNLYSIVDILATGEPIILNITDTRLSTVDETELRKSRSFYFTTERYSQAIKDEWIGLVLQFYPSIAYEIKSGVVFDRFDFSPVYLRKLNTAKQVTVSLLDYHSSSQLSFDVVQTKGQHDLEGILNTSLAIKILNQPRITPYDIGSPTIGTVTTREEIARVKGVLTVSENYKGGMDKTGNHTYSFNSETRPEFTTAFVMVALKYFIRQGDKKNALICATELYRLQDVVITNRGTNLYTTLTDSLLTDISLANLDLVMTVTNIINLWVEGEYRSELIEVCEIVIEMCDSPKTRYYTEIWDLYTGYSAERLASLNIDSLWVSGYMETYEATLLDEEQGASFENFVRTVDSLFSPTDPEPFRVLATLFYYYLFEGDNRCIQWYKAYTDFALQKAPASGKKRGTKVNVLKRNGVTIAPSVPILEILALSDSFDQRSFSVFTRRRTQMSLSQTSSRIIAHLTNCFIAYVPLGNTVPINTPISSEQVELLRNGQYSVEGIVAVYDLLKPLLNKKNTTAVVNLYDQIYFIPEDKKMIIEGDDGQYREWLKLAMSSVKY